MLFPAGYFPGYVVLRTGPGRYVNRKQTSRVYVKEPQLKEPNLSVRSNLLPIPCHMQRQGKMWELSESKSSFEAAEAIAMGAGYTAFT